MNRRAYLKKLIGQEADTPIQMPVASALMVKPNGLEAFTEEWTYERAAHLLRRTTFGPTMEQISEAVDLGMEGTLELLFAEKPLPDPPINYEYPDDPNVAVGAPWFNKPYMAQQSIRAYRNRSLKAWTFMQLVDEGTSIREKLVLFWHNHFAVANVNDPSFRYQYTTLLRNYAWGNFKRLIEEITVNPAMLRFLNGNKNTNRAPNENFARELLELYTVGKGDLAGPGDYTTFTEEDVVAAAKVLTGWRDVGFYNQRSDDPIDVIFRNNLHDKADKQMSHRFGNAVISNAGEEEYKVLIDIIFQQNATAKYICRKLYRWFVYYVVDESIEAQIITPLSNILIENNFEIKPVLEVLLSSQHFYDILNMGPMIKNPIDFAVSVLKQTYSKIPNETINQYYFISQKLYNQTISMQMEYLEPPQVAGWNAYYQEPNYYRTWINATTLRARFSYSDRVSSPRGLRFSQLPTISDPYRMMANIELEASKDPNIVVREFSKMLHPNPLTDAQYDALKEILIPGLPDFEWTLEYNNYLENPEDTSLARSIDTKLRNLLKIMLSMEEFQLS